MTTIIESDPKILSGKFVFKGTRIPVSLIFELLGLDYSIAEILEEYPSLTRDKLMAALEIGTDALNNLRDKNLERLILEGKMET